MFGAFHISYKSIRWLVHFLFWTGLVIFGTFILSYNQNYPFRFYLYNFLIKLPIHLGYTYFIVYYIVPISLKEKRYLSFFLLLTASSFVFSLVRLVVNKFLFYEIFIPGFLHPAEWFGVELVLYSSIWLFTPTLLFAAVKFFKGWMQSQKEKGEIEKRQLESELQFLKTQLNPHFLFNTLNNLYVLALTKNEKTPEIISKMSDLFHYILYECNAVKVPLSKEIKLIENYIELEMIRYSDRLRMSFNKNIENSSYQLPPMLLFTFVENCFKHGVSNDPEAPWIEFYIEQKEGSLVFNAMNSKPKRRGKSVKKAGVGLENIRKRLDLLYVGNYQMNIVDDPARFSISLAIRNAN